MLDLAIPPSDSLWRTRRDHDGAASHLTIHPPMIHTTVVRTVAIVSFVVAGAAACASAAERTFIAADDRTVTSRLEIASSGRGQQVIVQNSSTVEILVNGVVLSECQNIKTRCEVHRMRVPVGPGRRRSVFTIETDGTGNGHNFRYRISWEASNPTPRIPGQ